MKDETGWTKLGIVNDESLESLASQISRDKPRMVRISPEESTNEARVETRKDLIQLDPREYHELRTSTHPITKENVSISLSVAAQGIAENRLGGVMHIRIREGQTCYYTACLKYNVPV